jgi:hypothetical protein
MLLLHLIKKYAILRQSLKEEYMSLIIGFILGFASAWILWALRFDRLVSSIGKSPTIVKILNQEYVIFQYSKKENPEEVFGI